MRGEPRDKFVPDDHDLKPCRCGEMKWKAGKVLQSRVQGQPHIRCFWQALICGACGRSYLAVHGTLTHRFARDTDAMDGYREKAKIFLVGGRNRYLERVRAKRSATDTLIEEAMEIE